MHKTKETKRYGKKALVLVSALTLAANGLIGGTVAYLIAKTDTVKNTFTYGDIDITLTETDTNDTPNDDTDQGDGDNDPNTNTYEMVPGTDITKDPKVTVLADSEDSWLFVKLEKSANFDNFMTYEMADGWTALEDGVYYRTTNWSDADQEFEVLKDNTVTVADEVTKADLNALDANGAANYPTLTVTAYAVQRDADIEAISTVDKAWALAEAEEQAEEAPSDEAEQPAE